MTAAQRLLALGLAELFGGLAAAAYGLARREGVIA